MSNNSNIYIHNNLNNMSGSDSSDYFYEGSGSGSGKDENHSNLLILLLGLTPSMLCSLGCLLIFFSNIYDKLYKNCNNYKQKYNVWKKSKNAEVLNEKLSNSFITKLNNINYSKIDKKEKLDCSICLIPIHLEKFKLKKKKLVFLECSHIYHKDCLQLWVNTQIKTKIYKPNCPMCRTIIIDYSKKDYTTINYNSDGSDNSNTSVDSFWNN
jgi:hypothetical protein